MPETKYFLCTGECVVAGELCNYPHSHVIGHIQYLEDEGRKVTALARWDVSVRAKDVMPTNPVIDCYPIGDVRGIKCRYPGCSRHQRWEIGKAAFLQLMRRYGKVSI